MNFKNAKAVAGWQPGGTTKLAKKGGMLILTSTGRDPYISARLPKPARAEGLVLHFTMSSDSAGSGQVFWQEQGVNPPFIAERSRRFDVQHDGVVHSFGHGQLIFQLLGRNQDVLCADVNVMYFDVSGEKDYPEYFKNVRGFFGQ